jgi:hypothetical protein
MAPRHGVLEEAHEHVCGAVEYNTWAVDPRRTPEEVCEAAPALIGGTALLVGRELPTAPTVGPTLLFVTNMAPLLAAIQGFGQVVTADADAARTVVRGAGLEKDQQIAELKKAAAENDVECIICMDVFDKSDTKQWRMMIPCGHVFCSKCVEHHENATMPDCTLETCPICHQACEKFLRARIGGFVSDDALAGNVGCY